MERFVLDTSAIVAFRDNEPGSDYVEALLRKAKAERCEVMVSFMSFMELYYLVWRNQGKGAAHRAFLELKMLPVKKIDLSDTLLFLAGDVKATYPLSVADSWIASTAIDRKAVLVHKDPEFEPLGERVSLKALPYKH